MVGRCVELYRNVYLTSFLRAVSLPGDGVWIPVGLVIIAAAFVYFFKKDKVFALVLVSAPLFGEVCKSILKNYFKISRPEAFGCNILTTYGDKYSFPSGHTIFYTIFFGLLAYYSAKHWLELWAKILLPVSVLLILTIGYSRIYLGAHWYLDVIAGYIVGGAILAIAIIVFDHFSGGKNAHN